MLIRINSVPSSSEVHHGDGSEGASDEGLGSSGGSGGGSCGGGWGGDGVVVNNSADLDGGRSTEEGSNAYKSGTRGSGGSWGTSGGRAISGGPPLDNPVGGISAGGNLEIFRGGHEVALVNDPWSSIKSHSGKGSWGHGGSGGACVGLGVVGSGESAEGGGGDTGWGGDLGVELDGGSGLLSSSASSGSGVGGLLGGSGGVSAGGASVPVELGGGGSALGDLEPGGVGEGVSALVDDGFDGVSSGDGGSAGSITTAIIGDGSVAGGISGGGGRGEESSKEFHFNLLFCIIPRTLR